MWIVERGAQIMEFVNSILDSIGAIAKGNLGAVATKVEDSLAKALPVAISFLASLLGLGGISEKIRSIIDTVRAPINKAVDWVVGGAVKTFKKMFGGAVGWAKGKYEKGKAFVKQKVEAGKAFVKGKVQALKGMLGLAPEAQFDMDGEGHTLFLVADGEPRVDMASTRSDVLGKLDREVKTAPSAEQQSEARDLRDGIGGLLAKVREMRAEMGDAAATPEN